MNAPLTLAELLALPSREMIIVAGKDGSGKSSALVSLAAFMEAFHPGNQFWVIDTENKLPPVLKSWGTDAPKNIAYYHCPVMNDITEATDQILQMATPGDWLAVESMSRVWEKAQDLGYNAVTGLDKAIYLERRKEKMQRENLNLKNAPPVTPRPDDLWSITKGAHDGAFLERISQHETLNVLLTTTIAKPPRADSFRKESEGRKEVRSEFGIDVGIEGAPRLPYYAQTLCLLDRREGKTFCRVVRDNLTTRDDSGIEFEVPGRKMWAPAFMAECRA
jgi:energy-coupling factor transporter ATP-binding protein EcfA2